MTKIKSAIEEILMKGENLSILQVTKRLGNHYNWETIGRILKNMYDNGVLNRKTSPRPNEYGTWYSQTGRKPWVFVYSLKK